MTTSPPSNSLPSLPVLAIDSLSTQDPFLCSNIGAEEAGGCECLAASTTDCEALTSPLSSNFDLIPTPLLRLGQ